MVVLQPFLLLVRVNLEEQPFPAEEQPFREPVVRLDLVGARRNLLARSASTNRAALSQGHVPDHGHVVEHAAGEHEELRVEPLQRLFELLLVLDAEDELELVVESFLDEVAACAGPHCRVDDAGE